MFNKKQELNLGDELKNICPVSRFFVFFSSSTFQKYKSVFNDWCQKPDHFRGRGFIKPKKPMLVELKQKREVNHNFYS